MAKRVTTLSIIDASLARWKRRLKLAVTKIDKLEKQKKRIEKALTVAHIDKMEATVQVEHIPASTLVAAVKGHIGRVKITSHPVANPDNVKLTFEPVKARPEPKPVVSSSTTAPALESEPNLGIPDFLRRSPDPVAEKIREEQAETKRKKARGRIDKLKAKKAGELKKMPLSGKAALDLIRNG